jgi:hypothetical protein
MIRIKVSNRSVYFEVSCNKDTDELISGRCEGCIVAKSTGVAAKTDGADRGASTDDKIADFVLDGGIPVSKAISDKLDAHQKEGVELIWGHCFSDWAEKGKTDSKVT